LKFLIRINGKALFEGKNFNEVLAKNRDAENLLKTRDFNELRLKTSPECKKPFYKMKK